MNNQLNIDDRLRQFYSLYWLRPENAIILELRCRAINDIELERPILDASCGDGIFNFVNFGGRFELEFDTFEATGNLDEVRTDSADMFDSFDQTYQPKIIEKPTKNIDFGFDIKKNLLMKANRLNFYTNLYMQDATHFLPLSDDSFQTVTSFGLSINHYPEHQTFLEEVHRVLSPGGTFILNVASPMMLEFYSQLDDNFPQEWVDLIERDMRDLWPTMYNIDEWTDILEGIGFEIQDIRPVGNKLLSRVWNIGLRPIAPEMTRLRNAVATHAPNTFDDIKQDWVDAIQKLGDPFVWNTDDLKQATDYMIVMGK